MATPARSRVPPELESHQSFPVFRVPGEHPKNPLERFLALFADVRAGEATGALLLALSVFLLLTAYYLLKSARQPLILIERSPEVKSYSSALQAIVLTALLPAYAWFAARVNRVRLVTGAGVFFAVNLILFSFAGSHGAREAIPFYVWVGVFNVFSVSQFWAFANDIYTEAQGKRLFPIIGLSGSVGAVVGAAAATLLVAKRGWTPYQLMLAACILILAASVLPVIIEARQKRQATPAAAAAEEPLLPGGAFSLVFHDRYLFWIAILMVLLNIVNSGGEYLFDKVLKGEAVSLFGDGADKATKALHSQFIGAFTSSYYFATNFLGLVLQLFATSRVIRHLGVRGGLFVLPCISLLCYSAIAVVPLMATIRMFKTLENGTDYSIQTTVRQALYLPTSREAKYKAKAFNDTMCMRVGDVLGAGVVKLMTAIGAGISAFACANLLFVGGWLFVASRIFREHKRLTA